MTVRARKPLTPRTSPPELSAAISRQALGATAEKYSAANLERVELPDGRRLVVKRLPAEGDWLTRGTDGHGRFRLLWESGLLARVAPIVDHTVVDLLSVDGEDAIVMRDAASDLFPPRATIPRRQSRLALAGLAAFHRSWTGPAVEGLCSVGARYGLFAPAFHAADTHPGSHPLKELIVAGWARFADIVPTDVVDAVFAVHRDPRPLARRLEEFPATLLHGDVKLQNLGLGPSGLVAIDWGELTGFGPPEVDVAWYAVINTWRIGGSPDDVWCDYEAAGGQLDRSALDLACLGSLAQMGFRLANVAVGGSGTAVRGRAAALLSLWVARVRLALGRVGAV